MSLSQCGRRYPDLESAIKAAGAKAFKTGEPWRANGCWHIDLPGQGAVKLDPFPPVVAAQLDLRDEFCQRCGRGGRLERHHRRLKQSGGSKGREHTQCACNGLRLCRTCHAYVHAHVTESRDHGWIVLQSEPFPFRRGVNRRIVIGNAVSDFLDPQWPTCDGRWVHSPQEAEM